MISKWEAEFLENLSATFERQESRDEQDQDTEKLYAAIGQLKSENEFLKKVARSWESRFKGPVGATTGNENLCPQTV